MAHCEVHFSRCGYLHFAGQPGRLGLEWMRVGYKAGLPCPRCGAPIEKIRTGSTASFVCPRCQPL